MSNAQDVLTNLLPLADISINGDRPWDIQVHDRRFFSRVLASGTLGFGESYMDGWWDCDALDEMCCRAIRGGLEKRFAFRLPNVWAVLTALLENQQTLRRSRKVGRVHYDLSNDFFEAMLDPNMQYSCALFAEGDDLGSAQLRKLEWICERLRLRPGLRLLDIGCGWGGLARYAARHYGCKVVAITISRAQFRYAQRSCRALGVALQLRDYREATGPNYNPTLLAWEENFRRTWPRFADRYGERFQRMWRFYLLSCAGAFRARSLQVFSILFSKEGTPIASDVRDQRQAASSTCTAVLEPSARLLSRA